MFGGIVCYGEEPTVILCGIAASWNEYGFAHVVVLGQLVDAVLASVVVELHDCVGQTDRCSFGEVGGEVGEAVRGAPASPINLGELAQGRMQMLAYNPTRGGDPELHEVTVAESYFSTDGTARSCPAPAGSE